MLFKTSEAHEKLRAKVRAFAEKEVKPIAFTLDQKNEFTVSVYSFDIINPEKIKKEANSKFLKSIINLIHKEMKGETKFDGIILFKGDKNSFIYDFKFQDYSSFYHLYHPPTYINFTKMEQLKTFREALVKLKIKQGEPLTRSLIDDSKMGS